MVRGEAGAPGGSGSQHQQDKPKDTSGHQQGLRTWELHTSQGAKRRCFLSLLEMSTSGRIALPQNICKHTPVSSAREKLVLNCAASGPCNPNHHIKQKKHRKTKR